MNQAEKAARFAELHVKGAPLLLYNAWDAGTAKSILDAGAKAISTYGFMFAAGESRHAGLEGDRCLTKTDCCCVCQMEERLVKRIVYPLTESFQIDILQAGLVCPEGYFSAHERRTRPLLSEHRAASGQRDARHCTRDRSTVRASRAGKLLLADRARQR